jgi:hypothetical protein
MKGRDRRRLKYSQTILNARIVSEERSVVRIGAKTEIRTFCSKPNLIKRYNSISNENQ